MNPREEELFGILQEESAEIIQAVSKRRRFGVNDRNIAELKQEIADLIATLWLLETEHYIDLSDVDQAVKRKLEKLEHNMVNKRPI